MVSAENEVSPIDLFLGNKLRDFRNKVGWTLADLAEKSGVSHQQIHKYEQGYTKISASMLYKFSKIFSTTPNAFFEGFNPEQMLNINQLTEGMINLEPKTHINLLLVEDNPADEFLVRKALEKLDYKFNIYCLHEGEDVLVFLRKKQSTTSFQRPDIILLDLNLPKVSGQSILKSIKQDREIQDIPVLVLTSSLNKMDMINAYKNHASGYISKSFDYEVFEKNLKTAISYWVDAVVLPDFH